MQHKHNTHLLTPLGAKTFCCSCKEILRGIALEKCLYKEIPALAALTGFLLCWESSHGSGKSSPSPDAVHYYYYCFVARPATTRAQPTTATARSGRCACNPLTFGGKRQSCDQAISASRTSWHNLFFFYFGQHKRQSRRPRPARQGDSQRSHP